MRVLTAIVLLSISLNAAAWWNDEWTQRKKIIVDTTAAGANTQLTLTDAPVLVRLHSGNFPQFLAVRDNGADFRFVAADDMTPLKFHVERFDPISGLAFVWVRMPAVDPQNALGEFYLYFANQAAQQGNDAGASFDVNTVAAFHFNETSGLPRDATAYATPVESGELLPNPASLIGNGATLTGNAPLVLGDVPQLQPNPDNGWTFATWIRLNELPDDQGAIVFDHGTEAARTSLRIRGTELIAGHNGVEVTSFAPVAATQWHHVALVIGRDSMQLYLDGRQVGGAPVEPVVPEGRIHIGGGTDGGDLLAADIDELRISAEARGEDWIGFAARVQGTANDRVLRYQVDESGEGGAKTTGHFGIILQNVFGKPEAWVEQAVIILCGLMMAVAIVIMFIKAVDLRRAAQATKQFLLAFGAIGRAQETDDLQALYDAGARFGDSPLWRVYRIGVGEIRKRVAPSVGAAGAGIDAKAMSVVRAAMDAATVREGQRLNSKLVLLTIAISGGPFIGLFGTVVGVMVTFAAIAAIAPGMAAALLATVAGLGVAIPSLFGYNWLGSQARELVADMQVFADELEARFNEQYG